MWPLCCAVLWCCVLAVLTLGFHPLHDVGSSQCIRLPRRPVLHKLHAKEQALPCRPDRVPSSQPNVSNVCPEPVLANIRFCFINWHGKKKRFFPHLARRRSIRARSSYPAEGLKRTRPPPLRSLASPRPESPDKKTPVFCEFSLCLSRACLGKEIAFMHKWLSNTVFAYREHFQPNSTGDWVPSEGVEVFLHKKRLVFELSLCFVPSLSW